MKVFGSASFIKFFSHDSNGDDFTFKAVDHNTIDVWKNANDDLIMVIEPSMRNSYYESSQRIEIPKNKVNEFLDRLNKFRV